MDSSEPLDVLLLPTMNVGFQHMHGEYDLIEVSRFLWRFVFQVEGGGDACQS